MGALYLNIMVTSTLKLRTLYADTDKMGVVYYARYFEYFEKARGEMFRELGYPYSAMEDNDIRLPVIESHCEYKRGIKYDEVITIKTYIDELPTSRLKINYKILTESEDGIKATGYTIHSFVNKYLRPIKPSKDFIKLIAPLL